MYYKIKKNILYRKYKKFGYITDNSMFGYRMPFDDYLYPGEEYVSESGAVILNQLKKPHNILMTLWIGFFLFLLMLIRMT